MWKKATRTRPRAVFINRREKSGGRVEKVYALQSAFHFRLPKLLRRAFLQERIQKVVQMWKKATCDSRESRPKKDVASETENI